MATSKNPVEQAWYDYQAAQMKAGVRKTADGWEREHAAFLRRMVAGGMPAPPGTTDVIPGINILMGDGGAAARAAAAAQARADAETAKAKAAGKAQTAKENENTQKIIDALLKGIEGFKEGRKTGLKNAETALQSGLAGILASYNAAVESYGKDRLLNLQDEAATSAANIQNYARERSQAMDQVALQGGGETDMLRALIQVAMSKDANTLNEDVRPFTDTEGQINREVRNSNSQMATNRRNTWTSYQEAVGDIEEQYHKDYTDQFTDIQRTAASNSNIKSDYSTEFKANFGGYDPVKESSKYVGYVYENQYKDEDWYQNWEGRQEAYQTPLSSMNMAGMTRIGGLKRAQGSTLRRKTEETAA